MGSSQKATTIGGQQDRTALLVVDVQQGQFDKPTPVYKAEDLVKNIRSLVDRAHQAGIPVFYIQHADHSALIEGSAGWQIHPQLRPRETDHIVHKHHGNSFEDTTLKAALDQYKINTVVVTGLVTHGCVRATCIGAQKLGYKVILVGDAHSSFRKDADQLIQEWNQELSSANIRLATTKTLDFADSAVGI
jgi:nicotinamidase-related amidase